MLNKALEKKKGVHTWSQLFAEFFQSHGPSPCLVSPYTSSPMLASCQPVGHEYRYIFTLSSLKVFVLQTSACIHSSSVLLCNLHEIYTYWIPNCSSSVIPLASFGSNFALMNMQFKSAYTLDTQMLVSLSPLWARCTRAQSWLADRDVVFSCWTLCLRCFTVVSDPSTTLLDSIWKINWCLTRAGRYGLKMISQFV